MSRLFLPMAAGFAAGLSTNADIGGFKGSAQETTFHTKGMLR